MKDKSRRQLLLNSMNGALAIGLASLFAPFLSSCRKKHQATSETAAKEVADSSCPEDDNLSQDIKTARAALKYVDHSPISSKTCDNCRFFTLPKSENSRGGCRVLPGPIHPKGYCTSWIAQM